jgi:hypothetical protein
MQKTANPHDETYRFSIFSGQTASLRPGEAIAACVQCGRTRGDHQRDRRSRRRVHRLRGSGNPYGLAGGQRQGLISASLLSHPAILFPCTSASHSPITELYLHSGIRVSSSLSATRSLVRIINQHQFPYQSLILFVLSFVYSKFYKKFYSKVTFQLFFPLIAVKSKFL